jgi:hypothetical protein
MVNRCLNPDCRTEFKLLNAGDLYAYERRSADTEFFWLCSACACKFDLYLDSSGRVAVRARNVLNRASPPTLDGHLRLVSRSAKPMPRPQTIPSDERSTSFASGAGSLFSDFRVRGATHR